MKCIIERARGETGVGNMGMHRCEPGKPPISIIFTFLPFKGKTSF
jgi:hypothetical protein